MKTRERSNRIPFAKGDTGKLRIDREILKERVGRWTIQPIESFPGEIRMVYQKLYRNPVLERRMNLADLFMEQQYGPMPQKVSENVGKRPTEQLEVPEALSVEDAEKLTLELIDSYVKNPRMHELLKDARYFAGASALGGAVGVRRARAQIRRFEN